MDDPDAVEMVARKTQALIENCGAWSLPEPTLSQNDDGRVLAWITDQDRIVQIHVLNNGLLFLSDSAGWDSSPRWVAFHVNRLLGTVYAVLTDTNAKSRPDQIDP